MISFESDYIAGAHPFILKRLAETNMERLSGYGLMSPESDLALPDIAKLCDVFYIGGTKVGALCGEAVVFTKGNKPLPILHCSRLVPARTSLATDL